jgi:hypothetical protein
MKNSSKLVILALFGKISGSNLKDNYDIESTNQRDFVELGNSYEDELLG